MSQQPLNLRERTRRAVQKAIAEAAHALFVERGYDATTVNDIAAAAGMSQRSVFRYYLSKEEIILGDFDFAADEMLAVLRSRPSDEPVWESLRRVFDVLVTEADAPQTRTLAASINRVVFGTPALFARYLQRLQHMQEAVVEALIERARTAGAPYAAEDPAPRALAAAAFGCLVAAQHSWLASGTTGSFARAIDQAMAAVRPAGSI